MNADLKAQIEARLDVPLTREQEIRLDVTDGYIGFRRTDAFIIQRFHQISRMRGVPAEDLLLLDVHIFGDGDWTVEMPRTNKKPSVWIKRRGDEYVIGPSRYFTATMKLTEKGIEIECNEHDEVRMTLEENLNWIEAMIETTLKPHAKLVRRRRKQIHPEVFTEIVEWRDYPDWRLNRRLHWLTLQGRTGASGAVERTLNAKVYTNFVIQRFYSIASAWGCSDRDLLEIEVSPGENSNASKDPRFIFTLKDFSFVISTKPPSYQIFPNGRSRATIHFLPDMADYVIDSYDPETLEIFVRHRMWMESAIRSTLVKKSP